MDEIDLTDGNDKGRHVQPQGFVPSHLAAPMLRDRDARATAFEYTANTLGQVRAAADILASPVEDGEDPTLRTRLAEFVSTETGRAQRLVRALAVGALALLVAAGVTLGGGGRAEAMEAMEAPQPDPVAQTVRVVLGAAPVTVMVRATVYTPVAPGWYCSSVWTAGGRIGGTCSISPSFPVPVTIDPHTFPVGRSFAQVVDDATDVAVGNLTFDARRPSRFGVGVWTTTQYGDGLTVYASLYAYTPALGRWTPQKSSPVRVEELIAGRWVLRATATTNSRGVFYATVILGGGPHTVRVRRLQGVTVDPTSGTARKFYLVPTDIPDGVI